jgi:hypothetical protein
VAKHRKPDPNIGLIEKATIREPALMLTAAGIIFKLGAAFAFNLDTTQQALLNATIAAGIGATIATITRDGLSAGILGFAQAGVALAVGLGLRMTPEDQALLMSAIASLVGMYERTQVTAPEPPATR